MVKRTIRYPNSRKSPFEHDVGGYTRKNGNRVSGYSRGKGVAPRRSQRSRVVGRHVDDDTPIGVHAFTTNFTYSDKPGDGESVIVFSNNYPDALDEAWEERVDNRIPIVVECLDPDIGAALKWLGKRVRSTIEYGKPRIMKATKLGAKYVVKQTVAAGSTIKKYGKTVVRAGIRDTGKAIKAGYHGAKDVLKLTAFAAQKELIQSILKLCWQPDKAKQTAARFTLKKRFPDVYDMCDFSKERRSHTVARLPTRYRSVP